MHVATFPSLTSLLAGGARCFVMVLAILLAASVVQTQEPSPTPLVQDEPGDTTTGTDIDKPATKKEKRGSLIFAPIPIFSPTFGAGAILGVGYVFKLKEDDEVSPPSTVGLAVPFTNNGSRGLVIGGRLNFSENKYRTAFLLGKGRANLDFYGIGRVPTRPGVSVYIKGSGTFFFAEGLKNVWKDVFVGPRYQYRRITAAIDGPVPPGGFVIPTIDLKSTTTAIGFRILRDTTDSVFYPTKGTFWDFRADFFAKAIGSARTYQNYKATYNGYRTIGERQVLAYRAMACQVSEKTPFYDLCLFGRSDLRGYTTGEFQHRRMFATQAEYRRELRWRLGMVAFAGVGGIAKGWGDFRFDELLPAAGAGLRFKLDKKNHINYRIDVGYGRAGPTLSMSVTEAF